MREYQFHPIQNSTKRDFLFHFDDTVISAFEGETVIAAVLRHQKYLSFSEFDTAPRLGFCLMGACQDCSVWTSEGKRLRACRATVEQGQQLLSRPPMHGFEA